MAERSLHSDPTLFLGSTISGKYRVSRLLGQGGMGAVYEATNTQIGKRVALKFLSADATHDPEATQRFLREAQAASAIESAHIVQIFDAGTTEDHVPFLVMELLGGEDLRARLEREGQLPMPVALRIVLQVLRGLSSAHAAGIVHRDLKPENIFLCARDDDPLFVKLVDFGISKLAPELAPKTLTGQGTVMGTAAYMSPEQAQAFPDVDRRTDLYSVGAILFETLAGRPPHDGPTYESVLINLCTTDAPDVRKFATDVPEELAQIISRALSRDRDARFATAEDFSRALAEAAPAERIVAKPPGRLDGRESLRAVATTSRHAGGPASSLRPKVLLAWLGLPVVFILLGALWFERASSVLAPKPEAKPASSNLAPDGRARSDASSKAAPEVHPAVEGDPNPEPPRDAGAKAPEKPSRPKGKGTPRSNDTGVASGLKLNTDGP